MPFTQSDGHTTQTMWQLSFSGISETEAMALRGSSALEMIQEALRRTEGWIDVVRSLISDTPPEEMWATPLYDRATGPLKQRTRYPQPKK
jgi:hypothetical protein